MDSRDILTMMAAVALVAALAVVAPILTGRNSGTAPVPGTQDIVWDTGRPTPPQTPASPTKTASPTPTPWNRTPLTIGFETGTLIPTTVPPQNIPNRTMVTYATIEGRWSGTSKAISIPFPYWQMEYTAEPTALPPDVFPRLIIQVFDAGDPNRVVGIFNQDVYTLQPARPWVETFYEGNRTYQFQITTRFIKSFKINIKVPIAYV